MVKTALEMQCPACLASISIDEVMTKRIENQLRKELEALQKKKEEALHEQAQRLKAESLALAASQEALLQKQKEMDVNVQKAVAAQLQAQRLLLIKEARKEAEKEQAAKTSLLQEQLDDRNAKLKAAQEQELHFLKEKARLEEAYQAFALKKTREIEQEKVLIVENAKKSATEEQHYVIEQLKKQLSDATKAKDELARKLEQGPQQSQGEVLELELEDALREAFPLDAIEPVAKGMKGADIIQRVQDRKGLCCGYIVWELKNTKTWSESWIQKLKDNQRDIKADIAVIVSAVLPNDIKGFGFRDGVWICDVKLITALAHALRMNLESLTHEKIMSIGKNEKMEMLYQYLTGVEFKQRVESMVEAFSAMEKGLSKERSAFEKIWAEREKQIKKFMQNTVGMYGDLSGLVSLAHIKSLELEP